MQGIDEYGVWLAAVAGGVAALGYIGKKARAGYRTARAFVGKLARGLDQLENNGGSSMRDKIDRIGDGLDAMTTVVDGISDNVDALTERFETHVSAQADAQAAMWPAVEAIAKATPPT